MSRLGVVSAESTRPFCAEDAATAGETSVVVIASGKGGVGKSVLAALIASAIARLGNRVLLFDGSQTQGNLHILLDARPSSGLDRVLAGEIPPRALLMPIATELWLMPAGAPTESVYALTPTERARLHLRLTEVYKDFDVVVVDAGSGIESAVRSSMRAGRLIVVATPEPAALSDAYAVIKTVTLHLPTLSIDVLINQTRDPEEGKAAAERLSLASERFLRREIGSLGSISECAELRHAVRTAGGLLTRVPEDVVSVARALAPRRSRDGSRFAERIEATPENGR